MSGILISDNGDIAYLKGIGAAVVMGGTGGKTVKKAYEDAERLRAEAAKETSVKPPVSTSTTTSTTTTTKKLHPAKANRQPITDDKPATNNNEPAPWTLAMVDTIALWGSDNLFPQEIITLCQQSTELPALLDWKARAAQGKEVLPYDRVWNPATKQLDDVLIQDPDILSFFTSITTKRYLREAYNDFFWFANVFPDMIKNVDGDKIVYLGTHDASWCRWWLTNDDGVIFKCTVSSNWPNGTYGDPRYFKTFPVVNPYQWDVVDALKAASGINRFVYPISYPSPGKTYYQLANWDGIRTSGWLDLASKIPAFKQAIMQNQMQIKYLIKIPTNYWPSVYPNWEAMTYEDQLARKKLKLDELNTQLTGMSNAGKSILNEVGYDPEGKQLPGWEITTIDDKLKDGAYIEDSQEASAHLLRALGLDGTLVGQGPGRDLNAGGGSDKLIAYNMYCALQQPYRDVVLEPIYFIARYNGWMDRYPLFKVKTTEADPSSIFNIAPVSQPTQPVEVN
jgi:hypothetical protein